MKKFFHFLLTPSTSLSDNPVLYHREKILAVTLLATVIMGIVFYGFGLYYNLRNGSWYQIVAISLAMSGVLLLTFVPRIPYKIRGLLAVGYLYVFGTISSLERGISGETLVWLIGFSFFTAIFLGLRSGLSATIISTSTLLLVGFGLNEGWFSSLLLLEIQEPEAFVYWINPTILYFAIGTLSVYLIHNLTDGLSKRIQQNGETLQKLKIEMDQLEHRSCNLERRETQVRTAAQISRTISAQLNPDKLFHQVVELVRERFNLYFVGVFLVDSGGKFAVLHAGSGDEGKAMLEARHKLSIEGTSMIGWAISQQQGRIALDIGNYPARFDNPNLPDTRSELALPMISGKKVLGAITIQSKQPQAFDDNDIIVLQGVADSLVIAHENAILFQQIEANLQEIQRLNQKYLVEAWPEGFDTTGDFSYSYENRSKDSIPGIQSFRIEKQIVLRDQVIGNITLDSDENNLESEDEAFIEAVATQAALALENLRLMEATQRSAHRNRVVADLSSKVWASTDPNTILSTALKELVQSLQATNGLIRLEIPDIDQEVKNNGSEPI